MTRTLILGGGVAGLAAALSHARAGDDVLLLEKEDTVGGLCRTFHWHDCWLDLGPHRLFTRYPEVQALIEETCAGHLVETRRKSSLWLGGRFIDYPTRTRQVAAAVGWPRVFLLGGSFFLGRMFPRRRIELYRDVIVNQYGAEMYEWFFAPYARKTWRIDPELLLREMAEKRLPPQGFWQMISDRATGRATGYVRHFHYPDRGVGLLCDGLAERAQAAGARIVTSVVPTRLRLDGANVSRETFVDPRGRETETDVDRVVSSIPLDALLELLDPPAPDEVRQAARQLPYSGLVIVYVLLKQRMPAGDCWLYFPDPELCFNRAYLPQNFAPGLAPPPRTVLVLEVPCRPDEELYQASDEVLRERVETDLAKVWNGGQAAVADFCAIRLPRVYPLYTRDYLPRLRAVLEYLSSIDNLFSLGRHGLFSYNNSDLAIKMGLDVVEYAHARDWYAGQGRYDDYRIID
ncbi:FAD-dependent oxidoreductase [bacterium]|nr:FAD-dependent oxidoreductase [bacterium]